MEIILTLAFWFFIFWLCWKWFLGDWVGKLNAAKDLQAKLAARRIPDEAYFEMAGEEVARGTLRKGLWVQAMSEAMGDEAKAGAIYIRLRVQAMRGEAANAFRQASDHDLAGESFTTIDQVAPAAKVILSCPHCAGRLRVAANQHIDVTCPHCRAEFRTRT